MISKFASRIARANPRSEAGQSIVLFALGSVVFFGLVALSIDVGRLLVERRTEQNAADAAALAGAAVLVNGGSASQAISEARTYAANNGYTAGVTVNIPPTTGPSAGSSQAVEVIIQNDVPKYFAQVVYSGPWRASARAVGKITSQASGFGVITLNPSQCQSLTLNSNAQLQVTGGGIYVNSNCNVDAFDMESNAVATANAISVVGGFTGKSNYHATPQPVTGQPPMPDPFASIPLPPITSSPDRTGGGCSFGSGNVTFNPGVYNCLISLSSNTQATFNPGNYTFKGGFQLDSNVVVNFGRGIYVVEGAGFQMNSNTVVNGPNGVLIYNTCNPSPCQPGQASGTFQLNSNARLNIAPYGAPYSDIVVWQDRNSIQPLQFNSNSLTATGAIYAKSADIQYNSNATVPLQFVANNVQMNSNAKISVDVTGMATVGTNTMGLSE